VLVGSKSCRGYLPSNFLIWWSSCVCLFCWWNCSNTWYFKVSNAL